MSDKRLQLTKIFLALVLVYVAAEVIISVLPIHPYRTKEEILIDYQAERAHNLSGGGVLLLGDSSLGNAVDETLLSSLTGEHCRNLALVAFFGPRGDEILLDYCLSKAGTNPPRAIVLMHIPGNWNQGSDDRSIEPLVNRLSPPLLDDLARKSFGRLPSVERSRSYRSIFFAHRAGLRFDTSSYQESITTEERVSREINELGYIPQQDKMKIDRNTPGNFGIFFPSPQSEESLRKTFSVTAREGIEVFLAMGPYWEGRVNGSTEFNAELKSWLESLAEEFDNVRFLYQGTPAVPNFYIGDTPSHLNSEGKSRFTKWLGPILKAKLAGDTSDAPPIDWGSRNER